MMPGVAAQPLGRRIVLPDDTLATFSPETGVYFVAGVPVSVADIIDQPGWITDGALVMAEDAAAVNILGSMLAAILPAAWTLRLKWNNFLSSSTFLPLVLVGADFDDVVAVQRQNFISSRYMNVADFTGPHFRQATDASAATGDGEHTIALTRTDTALAFSVDGRAVVEASPNDFAISPTSACFGGYPGDTVNDVLHILSAKWWAPLDNSVLPALSA